MNESAKYHIPVLLEESVNLLSINPDGVYVDLTFGGGGHSRRILSALSPRGRLYGFDQDADAAANAIDDERFCLVESNFRFMRGALRAPAVLPDAGEAAHEDTMRHPFLYGLLTNLSNPKAVIYFGSIFSGLLSPDLPSWFTGGIFALVLLETFLWFGFVALVFGMENLRRGYRKAARCIDGFAGILFVGFGLSLIAAAAGLR